MKEARNAIIIILVLLFIIAGVGVAISRVADREKTERVVKTEDQRGFLERIFLRSKTTRVAQVTPTPTPGTMVITSETEVVETPSSDGAVAGTNTQTVSTTYVEPSYSDSDGAASIPATGTPVGVLVTSLMGLAGGAYLRRKSQD